MPRGYVGDPREEHVGHNAVGAVLLEEPVELWGQHCDGPEELRLQVERGSHGKALATPRQAGLLARWEFDGGQVDARGGRLLAAVILQVLGDETGMGRSCNNGGFHISSRCKQLGSLDHGHHMAVRHVGEEEYVKLMVIIMAAFAIFHILLAFRFTLADLSKL